MVSAMLLVIVFYGLAQIYWRGRRQVDMEEDRRRATAVVQARLDGIRRDYSFDVLVDSLNGRTRSFKVDGRTYSVLHQVIPAVDRSVSPAVNLEADTLKLTVSWTAKTYSGTVTRSMPATVTVLARGMP
jgi:hypothetical protein